MNRRGFLRGLATALSLPWVWRLPKALPKPPPPVPLAQVGSFDKWMFPAIRNMPSTGVLTELVSVQPMTEPSSEIVYMNLRAGGGMEDASRKRKLRELNSERSLTEHELS